MLKSMFEMRKSKRWIVGMSWHHYSWNREWKQSLKTYSRIRVLKNTFQNRRNRQLLFTSRASNFQEGESERAEKALMSVLSPTEYAKKKRRPRNTYHFVLKYSHSQKWVRQYFFFHIFMSSKNTSILSVPHDTGSCSLHHISTTSNSILLHVARNECQEFLL